MGNNVIIIIKKEELCLQREYLNHKKIDNTEHLVIDGTYAKQEINNTIVFVHKQKRVFTSLFSHIRNAFAHNQIFINGKYVTMYDLLKPTSSVFTMIAHVKIDVLKELIKTIKEIKEQ